MKLLIDRKLRLFEQLHQGVDSYNWRRAAGGVRCALCGLEYRQHRDDLESWDNWGDPVLKRLCDGELVKL